LSRRFFAGKRTSAHDPQQRTELQRENTGRKQKPEACGFKHRTPMSRRRNYVSRGTEVTRCRTEAHFEAAKFSASEIESTPANEKLTARDDSGSAAGFTLCGAAHSCRGSPGNTLPASCERSGNSVRIFQQRLRPYCRATRRIRDQDPAWSFAAQWK